jgi:hypothetical protein
MCAQQIPGPGKQRCAGVMACNQHRQDLISDPLILHARLNEQIKQISPTAFLPCAKLSSSGDQIKKISIYSFNCASVTRARQPRPPMLPPMMISCSFTIFRCRPAERITDQSYPIRQVIVAFL